MNLFLLRAGLLVGALACASVLAEPPPASLAAAVEAAWQRAPAARRAASLYRIAHAEAANASRWLADTPTLSLYHRDDRFNAADDVREQEVSLELPLWLPGQRDAGRAAASASLEAAAAAELAARLQVAGEVREAAWRLQAREAESALARRRVELLKRLEADVARRVRAGDLADSDGLAATAERLEAEAAQVAADQQLQAALGEWQLLTGLTTGVDPYERPGASDKAPAVHPELALARQSAEQARRQADALRRSRYAPPELSVGLRRDAPGGGLPQQESIALGLRIPLGSNAARRVDHAAALGAQEVASIEAQRLQQRRQLALDTARASLAAAKLQLQAAQQRHTALRERVSLLDKAFTAGIASLPELLRAMNAAADAESAVARLQTEVGLSRARLNQTLGVMP